MRLWQWRTGEATEARMAGQPRVKGCAGSLLAGHGLLGEGQRLASNIIGCKMGQQPHPDLLTLRENFTKPNAYQILQGY